MITHESRALEIEKLFDGIPTMECKPEKNCYHYWLIDRPSGPFSHGVCKFCREERDFNNLPIPYARPKGFLNMSYRASSIPIESRF